MKVVVAIVLVVAVVCRGEAANRRMLQLQAPRFTGTNQELDALVNWILQGGLKNSRTGAPPVASAVTNRQQPATQQRPQITPVASRGVFGAQDFARPAAQNTYITPTPTLPSSTSSINYSPSVVASRSVDNCVYFDGVECTQCVPRALLS